MSSHAAKRIDVLCLTYGEPPEPDWYAQFQYSLNILNRLTRRVAPIPRFITPLLAARRGYIRRGDFMAEGYRSPLEAISKAQVAKLQEMLARRLPDAEVRTHLVMEFRPPFIWEFLDNMRRNPPDEIILIPLYVAESDFTTGISRTDLAHFHALHRGRHGLPAPVYVGGFGFDERMGQVLARFVWKRCIDNGWTEEDCRDSALILGAHGTLQYPPPGINSGARETLHAFGLIRKHLLHRFRTVRVGWLNHTLGGKWTFPAVDETARECQRQGIRKVVYFPFGFMADNNESQREGRIALEGFEWERMLYLPCPNDDDDFCSLLADMVIERIDTPGRENWDQIEEGGRRDLVQRERPALPGRPGFLHFNGPTLAALGILFWLAGGISLTIRGGILASATDSSFTLLALSLAALAIGLVKSIYVLNRVMKKNLVRLRRIPQPSPLHRLFSLPTWCLIIFFMSLGISLRFVGLPNAVYACILLGVGLSLLIAALSGISNMEESHPHEVLRFTPHGPGRTQPDGRASAS